MRIHANMHIVFILFCANLLDGTIFYADVATIKADIETINTRPWVHKTRTRGPRALMVT